MISFEEMVEENGGVLEWYCTHKLGLQDADLDDLVAEVWAKAWKAWDRFDGLYPRAWLTTIARNTYITEYKRARNVREKLLREDTPIEALCEGVDSAEDSHINQLFEPEIVAAVNELNYLQAQALLWFTMYNMSYREIAEAQGVPVGTVMSRVFRARHRLGMRLA